MKASESFRNTAEWKTAIEEGRLILIARARLLQLITYTDFVAELRSFRFEGPHDPRLRFLLFDISDSEAEQNHPLLTALVVHKTDFQPGNGFFDGLAEKHGRDVSDRERCWSQEVKTVFAHWRER